MSSLVVIPLNVECVKCGWACMLRCGETVIIEHPYSEYCENSGKKWKARIPIDLEEIPEPDKQETNPT